ncbi:unnamed protein product [Boreogadus saida]
MGCGLPLTVVLSGPQTALEVVLSGPQVPRWPLTVGISGPQVTPHGDHSGVRGSPRCSGAVLAVLGEDPQPDRYPVSHPQLHFPSLPSSERRWVGDENAGNNVLSGHIITDRLMAVLVSSLHPCPDPSLHPPPTLPCPSLSVPLSVPLSSCESILASAQRGVVHILDVGDQSVLLTSKHHTYLSAAMATYWSAGLHSLLTWRAAPEV